MRHTISRYCIAVGLGWLALVASGSVTAAEPAREFLEKLRERGYYDTALDYLDDMATSPTAPIELKQTLEYERGTTLIDASRTTRDVAIREKQLNDAQAALKSFVEKIKGDPNNKLLSAAEKQLGNVLVERARMIVERAKKAGDPAPLLKQANGLYMEGHKVFDDTQKIIGDKLTKLPPNPDPKKDQQIIDLRDQLRIDYLQTQLLAAAIREESADTLDKKSPEYKTTLEAAAKEYGEIYEKYRTRLAGLYARLYQGRCFQKTGNDKEALSFFSELLEEQDADDSVRILKTKALLLSITSWMADSQKKYAEAVDKGTKWLDKIRPNESKESDWLELRLALAKALKAHSDQIKPMNVQQANQEIGEARRLAKFVSAIPGEFQKPAKQLLVDLGGAGSVSDIPVDPRTFTQAYEAGKEVLDGMKSAQLVVQQVPGRIAKEKDAAIKADLEKQLAEAQKAVAEGPSTALRLYRAAYRLSTDETDMMQVNLVQYYLSYLSYLTGNYTDAALIGDFVAKRYPESPGARQCAKIAMAAYVKMFSDEQKALRAENETLPDDKRLTDLQLAEKLDFESDHVVEICEYITQKWPDQKEAEEALNTLIPFMIQNKQLAKAEAYLAKIPADSPSRGVAELKTGQAIWGEYLRGMYKIRVWEAEESVPMGTDVAAMKKELNELKARAEKTLADGVKRMKEGGSVNPTFATAVLSLAQIYVDTNQTAKAVAELEDAKVGPLKLVTNNDPAAARPGFAEETLRVSLRAYIASLKDAKGDEVDKILAKANGVLDKLKELAGDTDAGKEALVKNYFSIARDLKSQIELAESPAEKSALSKGFEQFLAKVVSTASDFQILNWAAETFYGMGEAFDTGKGALTPDAKKYYEQAQKSFDNILTKASKQKGYVTDTMLIQLQLRSASCKRKLGDFAGAIAQMEEILKNNRMMVNVHVEAAKTYMDWGAASKDPQYYLRALNGGTNKPPGKYEPYIWGWIMLSNKTASLPAFREIFMETRLNLAQSRYRGAVLQKEKSKQLADLERAKRDIKNVTIVSKDYGGEEWRDRFDKLLKDIQRSLGEKQVGLKEFDTSVTPVSNKK